MAVFERLFRLLSDTRKQRKNCERTVKMTQAMMGKMDTNRHLKKEFQMSGKCVEFVAFLLQKESVHTCAGDTPISN